ncbi:MAG: hypothetical protein ACKO5K_12490, partial [Armatimonadota bacterium]
FEFSVASVPNGPIELAVERPDRFEVTINDQRAFVSGDEGWWVDVALRRMRIPEGAIRAGKNTVRIACDYRRDVDLEAVFLLGDFAVYLDSEGPFLDVLPETVDIGDLCAQGFPFYTGVFSYEIHLPSGSTHVSLSDVGGACVRFDGRTVPWPPYSAPADGERCVVSVVATRRNAFGPLHLVPKRQVAYGPDHWTTTGSAWSDDYQLIPTGLLAPPTAR